MSKVKYYYDSDSMSYLAIERRKRRTFKRILFFLAGSLAMAVVLLFVASQYIQSPQERLLQRELDKMEFEYATLVDRVKNAEQVLENIQDRDNNLYRVYFEAAPIPDEVRRAGYGGANRYKRYEGFDASDLIIDAARRTDQLEKQLAIQSNSLDEIKDLADNRQELLQAIPAIQPVRNKDLRRMASGYGWRTDPFTKQRKFHYGMDFTAPRGTPVYATGDGYVSRADNASAGYGNHIRIDHGYGYVSLYAHLYKYNVKKGQRVSRGDLIGYVGSTGRSQAPHLHYEVFKDKERINPLNFYYGNLSPAEYDKILARSQQENQSLD